MIRLLLFLTLLVVPVAGQTSPGAIRPPVAVSLTAITTSTNTAAINVRDYGAINFDLTITGTVNVAVKARTSTSTIYRTLRGYNDADNSAVDGSTLITASGSYTFYTAGKEDVEVFTTGCSACSVTITYRLIPSTGKAMPSGGSGTVSTVSVVPANGVSGTVANPTTTPAITLAVQNAAADGATKGVAGFTAADFDAASGIISLDYTNAQKATGSVPGFLSAADWTTFNAKQAALGFTPENVANKSTDGTLAGNSDTLYASQKATKTYADTKEVPLTFSSPLVRTLNNTACSTCVIASSPGAGIAHFAGSTQTVTSSLIVGGDITNGTIDLTTKVTGILPAANGALGIDSSASTGIPYDTAGSWAISNNLKYDGTQLSIGFGSTTPPSGPTLNVVSTLSTSPRGIASMQFSTDTNGARVGFFKARGSVASPTTIVTGDTLGRLMFRGYVGSTNVYVESASIEVVSTGTVADTSTGRLPSKIVLSTSTDASPSVLTAALTLDKDQSATFAGLGTFNASLRLDGGNLRLNDTGEFFWTTRSTISSPSDGVILFRNNADNSFTSLQLNADLILTRKAAANLALGAVANATPVANTLTIGESGSGTNIAGAVGVIQSGLGTGNAVAASLGLQAPAISPTSGTTAQSYVDRFRVGKTLVVANNTTTTANTLTVASNTAASIILSYGVEVFDGTDSQFEEGLVSCHISNKGGTPANNVCTKFGNQQFATAGTLTVTFTITAASPALVQVNANSSLTPSTGYPRVAWNYHNVGNQAVN